MKRIFLSFLLLICIVASPIMAEQRGETVRQIEMAKKEIIELEKTLKKLRIQQSSVQKELRKSDTDIANLSKKINEIKNEQTKLETELAQLNQDKQETQQQLKEQEKVISIQARATYESGRQEYIKLLLNQKDPEKISRTLVYYDYLSQARLEQLSLFKETLEQLKNIETSINQTQSELDLQNTELLAQRQKLSDARKKRQQILAALNKQIKDNSSRVSARERDQIELNKVLKTIDDTLVRQAKERELQRQNISSSPSKTTTKPTFVSTTGDSSGAFASARSKLPWPINGKIIAHYGSTRGDDSRAKWDGVLISAKRGLPVKAIHAGRVVYADWLRGVGLLIIIDHGQGYYSLYGHNQTLLKRVGDNIKAGDAVAEVGNSGGINAPALYFSIRQQGRAVNPSLWCRI